MKKRYLILAGFFLFNPIISVIDILPDFIGYLFLMKAFSQASYVYDNASETYDSLKRMMLISVFKLVSMIVLPSTDATMALVFSFTFAIIEVMYGVTAFQRLFDTTSYIYLRCDEHRFVAKCERLKRFTIGFFLTRIICSSVPDLFALFLSDPQKEDLYRFRGLMLLFFTIIALIVGIVWLVRFTTFYKNTLTDDVNNKIQTAFAEEMKDRQSVFFSKDFIFAMGIVMVSMLFSIDFYMDKIEVLSDILLAPLLAVGIVFLYKKGYIMLQKYEKLLFIAMGIHFISSILNTVFYQIYISKHLALIVTMNSEAKKEYALVIVFSIIEALSLLAIISLVLYLFNKYTLQRIEENPRFFSEHSVEGYIRDFKKIIYKKSNIAFCLAVASTISSIVYVFVAPHMETFVVINVFVAVLSFVFFIHTLSYSKEEVFKRILKYS